MAGFLTAPSWWRVPDGDDFGLTLSVTWARASHGDGAALRFPGFSVLAAGFLLGQRNVIALAIDTASMDPGNSRDFPVHRLWLGANRVGFENLCNADKLPPVGATIFGAPLKIGAGSGSPARIFALLP